MQWFRVYHHISTDPKLHKASRLAKVSRSMMLGAFVAVLDFSSQQEVRGSIANLDIDTFAYLIDCRPHVASTVLRAMQEVGLIRGDIVSNWAKYQRESDDVSARVKAHRQKKAEATREESTEPRQETVEPPKPNPLETKETGEDGNVTVTDDVTHQNRTESESESEEGRKAGKPAARYRFQGRVIRLTEETYQRWERMAPDIDLPTYLEQRDIFLAGDPKRYKGWFLSTSTDLGNKQQAAHERRKAAERRARDYRFNTATASIPG